MKKIMEELIGLAATINQKSSAAKAEKFICYLYKVEHILDTDTRNKLKVLDEELVQMQTGKQSLSLSRIEEIQEQKKSLSESGERTQYIFRLEKPIPVIYGSTPIRGSGGKITTTRKRNVTEIYIDENFIKEGLVSLNYCDEEGKIVDVMVMRKSERGTDVPLYLLNTESLNVEVSKDYFNSAGKLIIPSKVYLSIVSGDVLSTIGSIVAIRGRADQEFNHYNNL